MHDEIEVETRRYFRHAGRISLATTAVLVCEKNKVTTYMIVVSFHYQNF